MNTVWICPHFRQRKTVSEFVQLVEELGPSQITLVRKGDVASQAVY
jgi:hypothetical protein